LLLLKTKIVLLSHRAYESSVVSFIEFFCYETVCVGALPGICPASRPLRTACRTSLRVRLARMEEFVIVERVHSITFGSLASWAHGVE
jgi:hypothetical protein